MAQNLKTGDTVKIIAGNEKGKTARIVKIDRKEQKAYLEGIGMRDRHFAKTAYRPQGGTAKVQLGIHLSNLKKEEDK